MFASAIRRMFTSLPKRFAPTSRKNRMTFAKRWLALAILAATTFFNAGAFANDYPTRIITLVVPFAAGGPSDVIARLLANSMSQTLGQQVIIENVVGAGGTVGAARVARAAPDGYTLLIHHLALTAAPGGRAGNKPTGAGAFSHDVSLVMPRY